MDLDNYLNFNDTPTSDSQYPNGERSQVICLNEDNIRRELLGTGEQRQQSIITVQQSSEPQQQPNGQVRVFIIRDPVKNVIQAGNNLIVETEKNDDQKNGNYIDTVLKTDNSFQDETQVEKIDNPQNGQKLLIKPKGKKRPVPCHQKDELYWERRRKNNLAAKRSRESRRLRDNQTTMRTGYLETENMELREKINQVRSEILDMKDKLQEYNAIYRGTQVGPKLPQPVATMVNPEDPLGHKPSLI